MNGWRIVWIGAWLLGAGVLAAQAQPQLRAYGTLTGQVYDAETGEPLSGASVFLAGTLAGAATDARGGFILENVPAGTYELVASFVGYVAEAQSVRLAGADTLAFTFRLEPRPVEAGAVEVVALSDRTRRRWFERFRRFFLGVSENASKCEILNPEVLAYEVAEDERERFIVRAQAPLLIENRALGYRLHFVLDEFELRERQRFVKYRGRVGFTELTPADEEERKAWARRRRAAYEGSFRHFLTALVRDRLWDEGFMLLSEEKARQSLYAGVPGGRPAPRVSGVEPHEILFPGDLPFERRLDFPGYLKVVYFRERPAAPYLKFREFAARRMPTSDDEQISYIALNRPGVLVTTDGIVEDTYAVTKFGYWYFERVAEMLPREYHPEGVEVPVAGANLTEAALQAAVAAGVRAVAQEAYEEAVGHLAPVLATDPGFFTGEAGTAAYWLGVAYEALDRPAAARRAWQQGLDGLAGRQRFEIRMADAFIRNVFTRQDRDAYEQAAEAYLTLLERAGQDLPPAEAGIVRRHVAQMLPVLSDEERRRVVEGTPGPLGQGLRLHPDAGAFLATWWRRQDPLPATALNERVAEHLARVAYALRHFAFDGALAGFDDRGTAYVRYGPPYSKNAIVVDVARATQVLRMNGYALPGPLIPPVNELWTYRHVDDRIYYLFVQKEGRYQEASSEDLIPETLRDAHKRRGVGHTNPITISNPSGDQLPANQVMAEALFALWKEVYAQLALYHPDFERPYEELERQEADIRATRAGSARTISASALSFVNSTEARFEAQAREARRRREAEAPRFHSRIGGMLEPLSVAYRTARFLDPDGTTRTELYWSHVPGSLPMSRRLRQEHWPGEAAPPGRFYLTMTMTLFSEDYRRRVPTEARYLAADLPAGAPAPVQIATVTGVTAPYHLAVQWDQYLPGNVAEGGQPGAYLRTATARFDGLQPLQADPAVLEMSDLKPVYLEAPDRPVALENAGDATAPVPFPFRTLHPGMDLSLAFEVYHLAYGDDEQVHYDIEVEVVTDPGGRAVRRTSARTRNTGSDTTARELIGIDLRRVDTGPVRLVVRVTDMVTGRTVERSIDFDLAR
ncbi:MAG: hypothetical protein KatS3mg043_0118 [Rhodothermaceae bacterium]|nr:MAG: hypothetical protein KatS3mg043_0118 [Rhodothermaceae bacterium]